MEKQSEELERIDNEELLKIYTALYEGAYEISLGSIVTASEVFSIVAELLELRVAVEWKLITPKSLPKAGDEVGHWCMSSSGYIWDVLTVAGGVSIHGDYVPTEQMNAEYWAKVRETHYRPPNPPPMPTEGGKKEK